MPARTPGPIGVTWARVLVTGLPALVKLQSTTGLIGLPLLLFRYITTCQRWPGMARKVGFSMTTIGTVGPAVIGTEPTGRAVAFCSTICMVAAWARGSKAASSGPIGRPSWPTVSGVQTWPVLGSRNSGEPVVAATSTELLAWASTAGASVIPIRQSDKVVE